MYTARDQAYDEIQPLSLPKGSIRGLIALMISGLVWMMMLLPAQQKLLGPDGAPMQGMPLSLYFLMFLVGVFLLLPPAQQPGMPRQGVFSIRNLLRLLILAGFAGTFAYLHYGSPAMSFAEMARLVTPRAEQLQRKFMPFLLCLGGGITVGLLLRSLMSVSATMRHIFLTLQAWVSLLAMFSLLIAFIVLVVQTSRSEQVDLTVWECCVIAICSAYYGTRF